LPFSKNFSTTISLKQAYLLKLFQTSESLKAVYPRPDDKRIRISFSRRSWGLICEDINEWSRKQLLEDYNGWEEHFLTIVIELIVEIFQPT
jgi:hypothetical protein